MANSYLESIAEARRLVQEHLGDWKNIDAKVLEVVEKAQKIGSVPIESGSLKELNNRIEEQVQLRKQLNAVVTEQANKIKALQSQLSRLASTEKGRAKTQSDEERQLKTLEKAKQRLVDVESKHWREIEATRQKANQTAQATRNALTTYGAYSQKLIALTRAYKDLAIRKATLNNLTDDEVLKMNNLEAQITKLRTQLVQVDHSVGQFGRSVGSYGKQFDSLGFSMAQITREFPAFAYGAQIGFAALSNNLPILFDEIQKTRLEVAKLRAEGKETASVMQRLGSSIFGLQTLLSVGVTLLTLYGAEMIEAAGGMFDFRSEAEKAKDALKDMNDDLEKYIDSLNDLNKSRLKGNKSAQDELLTLKLLTSAVQDTTKSEEERKGALEELRKLYPKHLKNMTDEEALAGGVGTAYKSLAEGILTAARARAAYDKISENSQRLLEVELSLAAKQAERIKAQENLNRAQQEYNALREKGASFREDALPLLKSRLENAQEAVANLSGEIHLLTGEQQQLQISNIGLAENIDDVSFLITDSDKRITEGKRERIEAMEEMNRVQQYSVAYWEKVISALEADRKMVAKGSAAWDKYTESIEKAQNAIKIITDIQKWAQEEMAMSPDELGDFTIEVTTKLSMEGIEVGMKNLADLTGETLEELYSEMHNWYGTDWEAFLEFSEAKMRQKEIEAEKIKEIQAEIVNAAVDFGSALFEAEIERIDQRIEKNKDYYAQLLAGEELTQERRAALEAERDLRERKLLKEKKKRENQQFLFEQGVALARIAMNTAVAYSAALPNIPLATLIAILGGIQAATVIALSIPKFREGTENAPAGWAIVDEVTPEVHTDKHGRVKSYGSEKGPNLRFLEQGDRIYRNREKYFNEVGTKGMENAIWGLNMQHQGRPVPSKDVDTALLQEMANLRNDNNKVWREVRKLASRPIHNNVIVEFPDKRPY